MELLLAGETYVTGEEVDANNKQEGLVSPLSARPVLKVVY